MILLKICSPGKGLSIHVTIVRFNKILAILCFLEKLMILLRIIGPLKKLPNQWQTRRIRLEAEDANGKSARVLLPQMLCQWHLFALFCLRAAVPKVAARPVVCALVSTLWGARGDPCKSLQTDAGRAAQSTKKFYLHARPRLNASTVCVFSFEQSAYSKQIAEERKDTHSTQLTPGGASGPCQWPDICN
jgi:hypothetical protein